MARVIGLQSILLFLCLLCEHSLAQNSFEVSPEAFQILASEVEKLSKLVDQQNGVISVLNDRLNQQERTIEDLKAKLVKHDSEDRSSNNISTEPKTISNKVPIQHSRGQLKDAGNVRQGIIRKRQNAGTVAFFATITQSVEDNLGIHQNLIFEDVVTNIGNGYNNHHGVFTVPISGIYLLTTSVLSRQDQEYWLEVVVNGRAIARLNGHGTHGRHGTGTQTAIFFLKMGKASERNVHYFIYIKGFVVRLHAVILLPLWPRSLHCPPKVSSQYN